MDLWVFQSHGADLGPKKMGRNFQLKWEISWEISLNYFLKKLYTFFTWGCQNGRDIFGLDF